ncbi:hypothetical protein FNV43_RR17466 [Rhamnella rubrinervis]|uniref:Uncharacterized protein n=1 Tax=Rhamnella rubrinervis TaxID=2594499 RepID=A0A8K0DYV1_9ROSA|nr:hypothetical protein FNV43_RR17466 [Rhamnella rubrinervis]
MAKEEAKLHIAMFPWLAFGHINPYFELAKLIAQKGHKISFISTPRNIDRLPKLPQTLSPFINFVKLPLPPTENLPEDAEATIDLPQEKVPLLKNAYDSLQDSIANFLQSSNPDWVVFDFSAYWLPDIARNLGIPSVFFSIYLAACLDFVAPPSLTPDNRKKPKDYTVSPYWVPFPTKLAFRIFEILSIYDNVTEVDGAKSCFWSIVEVLRGCDVVAVRSCTEFELKWLQHLEKLHRKPVFPVGVLPPKLHNISNDDDDDEEWRPIKEWLDKQVNGSVIYVAFGTEAKLRQDELTEMAYGLELSGLPFFWVLRMDHDSANSEMIELPVGFEERTKGRGIVCTTWAPQLNILAHDSIGGFLTHSGWSSVVEALQFGRPLILFTFSNDQGLNARLLEEKMIGYSVPRDEHDGWFTRQSVAESLKLVAVKEEGKIYRDKAKEMKLVIGDMDIQDNYLNEFLGYLSTYRRSNKAQ